MTSPPIPTDLAGAIERLEAFTSTSETGFAYEDIQAAVRTVLDRLRLADELAVAAEPFAAALEDASVKSLDLMSALRRMRGAVSIETFRALASKLANFRAGTGQ